MKRRLFITLSGLGLLAACGSRLDPRGWFGSPAPVPAADIAATGTPAPDPRPLIPRVTELSVEAVPGGAVVRATGLPDRQGWHTADLVAVPSDTPGVLAFRFHALPPPRPTRVSTPASREVVVATRLSNDRLAGIGEIRVSGATDGLAVRR